MDTLTLRFSDYLHETTDIRYRVMQRVFWYCYVLNAKLIQPTRTTFSVVRRFLKPLHFLFQQSISSSLTAGLLLPVPVRVYPLGRQ